MSLLEMIQEISSIPRKNREKRKEELKLYEYLYEFKELGDNLIQTRPEILDNLKQRGYISPVSVEIHSLSALIDSYDHNKPRQEPFTISPHYIWTDNGHNKYKRLQKIYGSEYFIKKMLSKKPAGTTQK